MAAVLACGEGAVVSHRSAAALWGIRPSARAAVDVSVPGRTGRSRPGIDIHRCALPTGDVTTVDGIPCTTVAGTLLDLAELTDLAGVERAIAQAEVLRVYDHSEVEATLARANGRRGTARLRTALDLQSELEERFLAICDRAGIRRPEMNAWIPLPDGDVEIDFLWRRERLAVETDGRGAHATVHAFEADRARDQRLVVAGWRPVRFTRRQVVLHADDVRRRLLALLD